MKKLVEESQNWITVLSRDLSEMKQLTIGNSDRRSGISNRIFQRLKKTQLSNLVPFPPDVARWEEAIRNRLVCSVVRLGS